MSARKSKFGHVRGGKVSSPITMTDAEVINTQSARFITNNAGAGELADASDDYIIGFVESGNVSSTSDEQVNNIHDLTAVFMVPFLYDGSGYAVNYSSALKYTTRDIVRVSNVQYIDLATSTKSHVLVVNGRAASAVSAAINDGYVEVMIYNDAFIA